MLVKYASADIHLCQVQSVLHRMMGKAISLLWHSSSAQKLSALV